MDFNVKKFVGEAGTAFSRLVQLTEEKLGTSERTELDSHFESLLERSDATKMWTEKLLKNSEAVLTPNPGYRVEDFLFEKIEKKRPNRLTNLEYLGLDMMEAGNVFGSSSPYGSSLIKVGQIEQKLGTTEREYIGAVNQSYIMPLRKFLDGEMKTIMKERSILENKRIDLDACKNKLRKARSIQGQQAAERELRVAQAEFDRQAEITRLLLEGISSSHASHLRCLHEMVQAQANYHAQCNTIMQSLATELANASHGMSPTPAATLSTPQPSVATLVLNSESWTKARVLCDYDANAHFELSLMADEVIDVVVDDPADSDYVIGQRGSQRGKVPRAFLEPIS
ncbi:endophilin-B1 isoform X2 [Neocloeon triangulifer]|uniref:endophilin-B1 isoform X2 n=1 Tax=Neocloeon triangulifer TaxID=2078957 RepID=UPI00286EF86F|nr:endophilin-B1 isoform X2 [Neocloeon triangulifer]